MAKKYIDFCAREGIPTHSITSTEAPTTPWYHQSKKDVAPGPDTDVTRPRANFDLAAIRRYADSKNVRLWIWVHQAALRGRVEEAFAAFQQLGWSGMMVDFFDVRYLIVQRPTRECKIEMLSRKCWSDDLSGRIGFPLFSHRERPADPLPNGGGPVRP